VFVYQSAYLSGCSSRHNTAGDWLPGNQSNWLLGLLTGASQLSQLRLCDLSDAEALAVFIHYVPAASVKAGDIGVVIALIKSRIDQ